MRVAVVSVLLVLTGIVALVVGVGVSYRPVDQTDFSASVVAACGRDASRQAKGATATHVTVKQTSRSGWPVKVDYTGAGTVGGRPFACLGWADHDGGHAVAYLS